MEKENTQTRKEFEIKKTHAQAIIILFILIILVLIFTLVKLKNVENNFYTHNLYEGMSPSPRLLKEKSVKVLSPIENDQFCVGDTIPIKFETSHKTKIIRLWETPGLGGSRYNLGEYRPILEKEDKEENKYEYLLSWDQKNIKKRYTKETSIHRIIVETEKEEGTSDIFAITNCTLSL